MILAEMGIAKKSAAALNLQPQYSSDFLSFSLLQREIDEKCLRKAPGQFNQVDELDEILDELSGAEFLQYWISEWWAGIAHRLMIFESLMPPRLMLKI